MNNLFVDVFKIVPKLSNFQVFPTVYFIKKLNAFKVCTTNFNKKKKTGQNSFWVGMSGIDLYELFVYEVGHPPKNAFQLVSYSRNKSDHEALSLEEANELMDKVKKKEDDSGTNGEKGAKGTKATKSPKPTAQQNNKKKDETKTAEKSRPKSPNAGKATTPATNEKKKNALDVKGGEEVANKGRSNSLEPKANKKVGANEKAQKGPTTPTAAKKTTDKNDSNNNNNATKSANQKQKA
ncbi:hypothetical protein RFI_27299, partial [Reticulomyxa filosa]